MLALEMAGSTSMPLTMASPVTPVKSSLIRPLVSAVME